MNDVDYHIPVLLKEVIDLYAVNPDGIYVDGTLGGGGHFRAVAKTLSSNGVIIGIDRDIEAVKRVEEIGFGDINAKVILERERFSQFDNVLRKHVGADKNGHPLINGIFVDLGVSSRQIDISERGFRYMSDAPLDMRMDQSRGATAAELLSSIDENDLAEILDKYGEIRNAGRMAAVIKSFMKNNVMTTSADLKRCITLEYGERVKIQVFAKLFQALRIAVNDELGELRELLDKSIKYLAPGGRIAVISYHSLEDRMVKEFFKSAEGQCVCPSTQPVCTCDKKALLKRVNRKAVTASAEEAKRNPRARSARLRVAEKVMG